MLAAADMLISPVISLYTPQGKLKYSLSKCASSLLPANLWGGVTNNGTEGSRGTPFSPASAVSCETALAVGEKTPVSSDASPSIQSVHRHTLTRRAFTRSSPITLYCW